MPNLAQATIAVELKRGLLYKFLTNKLIQCLFIPLPRLWFYWCLNKSMQVKIGGTYQRLSLKTFGF